MSASALLDSNALLYAISTSPDERPKREIARMLLARQDYGLSVQVLQEFYVNATREPRPTLTHEAATLALREWMRVPMVASDVPLMQDALDLKVRYRISYWDAAIVAAARVLRASVLYTEDLSNRQIYAGIRVENPFEGLDS